MVIIATLSTVLIVIINPKRQIQRANDGRRKAEMKQIQAAMELYRADNGEYPKFDQGASPSIYGHAPANLLDLNINGITYLSTIPAGPNIGGNVCRGYLLTNSAGKYTLFTILENTTDPDATSAKDPINNVGGNFTTNNITTTVNDGSCAGYTYNFWVNNP